jgi:hypothetical protein
MTVTPTNTGYTLVDTAGNLVYEGSASHETPPPGQVPANSAVGLAATYDGGGYWIVDQAGTVYPYGDATTYSGASVGDNDDIVGIVPTPDSNGYWLFGAFGDVYPYGDASKYPFSG